MHTRKKKQSRTPGQWLLILALIGLLGYKNGWFEGVSLDKLPSLPSKEQSSPKAGTSQSAAPTSSPSEPVTSQRGSYNIPNNRGGIEIPVMTSRKGGQILKRKGYTASYDADYKTPQWVAWELTRKDTQGRAERTNKFLPDSDVRGAKAYTGDYTNSGYDRGHMAPAADMKWSKQAMEESFYLSNICPQNPNLNRGDWNDLEEKCRDWAKEFGVVYIACGPIYDSKRPKRMGNNKIAVPDAFYKVVFIHDKQQPKAFGFLFPNQSGSRPLRKYLVTVDSVEKRTGIDFFPALSDELERQVEAQEHTRLP